MSRMIELLVLMAATIIGAYLLFAAVAGATTHTIMCDYTDPCVACPEVRQANNDELPCQIPTGCLFDDTLSWTGWATHGILCPPSVGAQGCMFQFSDSRPSVPVARSIPAPLCAMDGKPLRAAMEAVGVPSWSCRWFGLRCK